MTNRYTVDLDPVTRRLGVTLRGNWDLATAQAYTDELEKAAARLRRQPGPCQWLIDLREFPVQPREIADHLRQALPAIIPPFARIALVVATALVALQSKRVGPEEKQATFTTYEAAEEWLAEGRTPDPARGGQAAA